ncbi:hypothetical protein M8J77_015613 [Diaphorina citri]|nr:hypothetical protein M8J77_015613 [Diaphorina citri]
MAKGGGGGNEEKKEEEEKEKKERNEEKNKKKTKEEEEKKEKKKIHTKYSVHSDAKWGYMRFFTAMPKEQQVNEVITRVNVNTQKGGERNVLCRAFASPGKVFEERCNIVTRNPGCYE